MISKSTHVRRAEQQRMFCCCYFCFALFFAPNALWWWAWGWRRFLWSISEKKLGLMVVSPISFSLQFCMLSGVLKSISSWQLVKSQRPPQKASSTHPLWLSSREKKKKNIIFSEEKKPASSSTQVQYCPTYLRDSIDPADNLTLGIIIKRLTWYFHTTCQSICVSVNLFFEGSWTLYTYILYTSPLDSDIISIKLQLWAIWRAEVVIFCQAKLFVQCQTQFWGT